MEEKKGLVFGIQHFSIHDGDGIRSNVFLKGCPLRCLWCHNPEGLSPEAELQYHKNKCVGCGKCGHVYQRMDEIRLKSYEEKKQLVAACVYHALEMVGEYMTAEEILDEVCADAIFFRKSGGGITVSGGEPMMQPEFTTELLKKAKERGMRTAMETSGFAPLEKYREVLPYVDQFLWDWKAENPEKYKEFTGVVPEKILKNLTYIHSRGADITLRCPIIPGLNDTTEHFRGIAEITCMLPSLRGAQLMPYHKYGVAKGERIGNRWQKEYEVPSKEDVEQWKCRIREFGGKVI
jgi:glycyl-radical enzyme activating protein